MWVEVWENIRLQYKNIWKKLTIGEASFKKAVSTHQIVLETFAKQIENTELTSEERDVFLDKMVEEAEKITELYLQQKIPWKNKKRRWNYYNCSIYGCYNSRT